MYFNSINFIFLFLPFSIVIYYLFTISFRNFSSVYWLIFVSLFYYFILSPIFLLYLILSSIINYNLGIVINNNFNINKNLSKKILILSIILNILYLGYFKYFDFFISTVNNITTLDFPLLNVLLPLGISFYTIQQIIFLVKCYDEKKQFNKYNQNFKTYFLHVIFFPKIIAGPIISYDNFIKNFTKKSNIKKKIFSNLYKGFFLFSIGLFKKVILADNLAYWNDHGFSNISNLNLLESWILCYSYAFQLYFDVSGYADMAIGIALLFGIAIPINFNSPFKQTNISNLWNNWHMTLTNFINNYLFRPIIFSFKNINAANTTYAIIISMTVVGLWHGANWTFIMLGFLNGIGIAFYHFIKNFKFKLERRFSIFLTFTFFSITILFFRVEDLQSGFSIVESMFNITNIVLPGNLYDLLGFLESYNIKFGTWSYSLRGDKKLLFFLALSFYLIFFCKNSNDLTQKLKPNFLNCTLIVLLFVISVMFINNSNENIYFQF